MNSRDVNSRNTGISRDYGSYHYIETIDKPHVDIDKEDHRHNNQCVLGVAFYTFLGFTIIQSSFAIKAKSQSMLADSEAMFVDVLTYLFNMLAERRKSRVDNEKELAMSPEERNISRRLHRLYLELIPPCISVIILLTVTVNSIKNAITTLLSNTPLSPEDTPDLFIMMIFSVSNSILDIVNVACFVNVDHAFLSPLKFPDMEEYHLQETCPLVLDQQGIETAAVSKMRATLDSDNFSEEGSSINLNMCSAWTHVFADTLRSIAVLSAACIAYNTNLVSAEVADAFAAVIVSLIILLSCLPLTKGLVNTAMEIRHMHRHESAATLKASAP